MCDASAAGGSAIDSEVAPVSGGAPSLIIRFDDPARPSGRREIATDGKRMFFSLAQQEADVWLVEIKGP
jgi:hypothetical protein